MAQFSFARQSYYPDLDLEVDLRLTRFRDHKYTAHASVKARGQPGARQRWRDEFWAWAHDRNLDAFAPRYGNRRIDGTSVYDCYLKDWQTVADFIVMWVGLEALSAALAERDDLDRLGRKVRDLTAAVESMNGKVARLEQVCLRQDETWEKFRAFVQHSNPLVGLNPASS